VRTPSIRTVLWDVDGTLLLNSANAGTFYHDAIREVAGVGPAPDEPHAVEHGKTDAQIITERLERWGGDPARFAAVSARLDELSGAYLTDEARRTAAPGVAAALEAVAAAGWVNGLLTGNSRHRARVKLAGAGVPVDAFDWSRSFFGDRAVRRSDLTAAAQAELAGSTAVILGDTPADGAAADAVGFPFLAVATGAFPVET
jgi:phosphoglycolate phosphatase